MVLFRFSACYRHRSGTLCRFACAVAVYLVTFRWDHGHSGSLGFMGYLPLSDALGYFWCSVVNGGMDTLATPQFPIEWCARRIFYPTALASFLGLTGWQPQLVLLVQAALIGCAISVFALVVARYIGRLAAIVTACGLVRLRVRVCDWQLHD